MYYSTTDFLGLGNVSGTLVEENSVKKVIQIETQPHEVVCPCCGGKTSRVHDYRLQDIKSLSYDGKSIYLRLRKRRYACQCGKRFYEKYSFVSKYNRMTNDVYADIFNDCKTTDSYKSIAQKHNVSKQRTFEQYRKIAEIHILPRLGEYELMELTPFVLQKFVTDLTVHGNKRTGKGLSPNFVKNIISVVQNSPKTAHLVGYLSEYMVASIKIIQV